MSNEEDLNFYNDISEIDSNIGVDNNEMTMDISLIGNSSTGKTSIIKTYQNKKFDFELKATIGFDYKFFPLKLSNDEKVILKIIDTAGTEVYRSLCLNMLRNNKGVILVYSINDKKSFDDIANYWISEINDYIQKDAVIYLVGNKSDLKDNREISFEEGNRFAKNNDIKFMETSAKNNENIQKLFKNIVEDIYIKFFSQKNNKNDTDDKIIILNINKSKKHKLRCCKK